MARLFVVLSVALSLLLLSDARHFGAYVPRGHPYAVGVQILEEASDAKASAISLSLEHPSDTTLHPFEPTMSARPHRFRLRLPVNHGRLHHMHAAGRPLGIRCRHAAARHVAAASVTEIPYGNDMVGAAKDSFKERLRGFLNRFAV